MANIVNKILTEEMMEDLKATSLLKTIFPTGHMSVIFYSESPNQMLFDDFLSQNSVNIGSLTPSKGDVSAASSLTITQQMRAAAGLVPIISFRWQNPLPNNMNAHAFWRFCETNMEEDFEYSMCFVNREGLGNLYLGFLQSISAAREDKEFLKAPREPQGVTYVTPVLKGHRVAVTNFGLTVLPPNPVTA